MYCKKCGKEIKDGDLFCSGCGVTLKNEKTTDLSPMTKHETANGLVAGIWSDIRNFISMIIGLGFIILAILGLLGGLD